MEPPLKSIKISNNYKDDLNEILDKSNKMPKQRTVEWIDHKQTRIGGSEMNKICSLNNNNIDSFIKGFLLDKLFKKKVYIKACQFGILFENEIHKFTEMYHNNIKIHEVNIIQHDIESVCYSPDGVGCVNNELVLFEFKCPITRIPIKNKIKPEYKNQILTGLIVLDKCKYSLYCEGEFKICELYDLLNTNKFNTIVHNKDLNRNFTNLYNSYGIIYIYTLYPFDNDTFIDFGTSNENQFNTLLYKLHNNEYKQLYVSDLSNNNNANDNPYNNNKKLKNNVYDLMSIIDTFHNHVKSINGVSIGYIPYKLYNYNVIKVERENNFFNDIMINKLKCVHNILTTTKSLDAEQKQRDYIINSKEDIKKVFQ